MDGCMSYTAWLVLITSSFGAFGLYTSTGDVVWKRQSEWTQVTPSGDWQRFLAVSTPSHGVAVGTVELVARDGTSLWKEDLLDPIVAMNPEATHISISSDPGAQNAYGKDFDSLFQSPIVLGRDGRLIAETFRRAEA